MSSPRFGMIAYTVSCIFDEPVMAEEWLRWLRDEHLAEVCAAGALDAEVVKLAWPLDAGSGAPARKVRCEARYHFESREAFERYERDHAPRLRAAGLRRFPPQRGLRYERSVGEVEGYLAATGPAAT